MTGASNPSQRLGVVFVVAAISTFLMAAAASTIVARADGPGEREAAFAANSIVVADVGQPVGEAPVGVRVPQLVEVSNANLFEGAALELPAANESSARTVNIALAEAEPAALIQAFAEHAQKWELATSDPATQLRDASIDVGVRLRKLGVLALVLPRGFLTASTSSCAIVDGLYRGGTVPVFHLPAAGVAESAAMRACLKHFKNRGVTFLVDAPRGELPEDVGDITPHLTFFYETTKSGLNGVLSAGAAAVLVDGEPRDEIVSQLVNARSETTQEATVAAAQRMSRWYAKAPPAGSSPSTAAPAAHKAESKSVKVKPLKDITPKRHGNDGQPVAPRQPAHQTPAPPGGGAPANVK
jgi:hypothetical protein